MSAESAIRMFFRHIFNQYMEMPFLIKFTTDQDYHCGAHISGRNKLRSLLRVIIERVADFLDRGAASGEFRSEINPEFFYTATMLMLRGCFVRSSTASLFESIHLELQAPLLKWPKTRIVFAIPRIS